MSIDSSDQSQSPHPAGVEDAPAADPGSFLTKVLEVISSLIDMLNTLKIQDERTKFLAAELDKLMATVLDAPSLATPEASRRDTIFGQIAVQERQLKQSLSEFKMEKQVEFERLLLSKRTLLGLLIRKLVEVYQPSQSYDALKDQPNTLPSPTARIITSFEGARIVDAQVNNHSNSGPISTGDDISKASSTHGVYATYEDHSFKRTEISGKNAIVNHLSNNVDGPSNTGADRSFYRAVITKGAVVNSHSGNNNVNSFNSTKRAFVDGVEVDLPPAYVESLDSFVNKCLGGKMHFGGRSFR